MKYGVFPLFALLLLGTGCSALQMNLRQKVETQTTPELTTLPMHLSSTAFPENSLIPSQYTCDGSDTNPPLEIQDVPDTAKSLVLIVDDPDATRGDWTHWLIWNIDPMTKEMKEGKIPPGAVEGTTDFGRTGYGGPCPQSGTHRYQFKLYALDTVISLPSTAKKTDVEKAIDGHVLNHARLIGLYTRQK